VLDPTSGKCSNNPISCPSRQVFSRLGSSVWLECSQHMGNE
jgi:hypothetical protein